MLERVLVADDIGGRDYTCAERRGGLAARAAGDSARRWQDLERLATGVLGRRCAAHAPLHLSPARLHDDAQRRPGVIGAVHAATRAAPRAADLHSAAA
jgi:hypothetical protein